MARPAAMAGLGQINSFVGKFINLWQSGLDASIQIQTSAGKAQETLQAGLGEAPPSVHHAPPQPSVPGLARLRRRQRRADARIAAEEADQQDEAEQARQNLEAVQAEHERVAEEFVQDDVTPDVEAEQEAAEAILVHEVTLVTNKYN